MKTYLTVIILSFVTILALSGCTGAVNDEEDRLVEAGVDIICAAKNIQTKYSDVINETGVALNMVHELEVAGDDIALKYGFANLQEMQELGKKYELNDEMADKVKTKTKERCDIAL